MRTAIRKSWPWQGKKWGKSRRWDHAHASATKFVLRSTGNPGRQDKLQAVRVGNTAFQGFHESCDTRHETRLFCCPGMVVLFTIVRHCSLLFSIFLGGAPRHCPRIVRMSNTACWVFTRHETRITQHGFSQPLRQLQGEQPQARPTGFHESRLLCCESRRGHSSIFWV